MRAAYITGFMSELQEAISVAITRSEIIWSLYNLLPYTCIATMEMNGSQHAKNVPITMPQVLVVLKSALHWPV